MANKPDKRGPEELGRVVACYGRRLKVETADGTRLPCLLRGRRLRAVCGDRVRFERPADSVDGLVVAIEPRDNELSRPDRRGRAEVLAANLDQVVVVAAPRPDPDPFMIDRYLASAALLGAPAIVVANKTDLDGADDPVFSKALAEYEAAGYPVLRTSAKKALGLGDLSGHLAGRTSILVGQSGVGKSSLLNALLPEAAARTQEVSVGSGEGRHTTTASHLYHLSNGGAIIDSPGVRDYAPPPVPPPDVARGYREFAAFGGECRFHNCLHLNEPDCAVRAAVETGEIPKRRYESYRRLLRRMRDLERR